MLETYHLLCSSHVSCDNVHFTDGETKIQSVSITCPKSTATKLLDSRVLACHCAAFPSRSCIFSKKICSTDNSGKTA